MQSRIDRRQAETKWSPGDNQPVDNPPLWRDALFWLTLLLTLFAMAPFALPGYFWGANDARHHVYFLYEYDRAVQDGIWWPRWCPDFTFGYGYPFFNIYGLLSHFLAELFLHFLSFSHTAAIEVVFCLSIVGSATTMYLFVRDWIGRPSALIAALVYTYLPYHLLNLYVRANLAESMALVWLPLCLWAVRNAIRTPGWKWLLWCVASYGCLMLTSNLVIVLFTPWLGVYVLVLLWDRWQTTGAANPAWSIRRRLHFHRFQLLTPALGLLAALGVSANFWIPAFLEQRYVRVDQWYDGRYDFHDDFVYWYQLFRPTWGFGVSQPGPDDPISFQIGLVAFGLAIIGCLVAWNTRHSLRREIACFALIAVASVALALTISAPLWDLPLIGSILQAAQFPWRWFSIMAPFLSILAGLVASEEKEEVDAGEPSEASAPREDRHELATNEHASLRTITRLLPLVALIILASYPYLQVQIRQPAEGQVGLAALMRFQRDSDEMTGSTSWVQQIPRWSPIAEHYVTLDEQGAPVAPVTTLLDDSNWDYNQESCFAANSYEKSTISERFWFCNQREEGARIYYNHFYYPGWRAWLLDEEYGNVVRELPIIPETEGVTGRMTIPLPRGDGFVLLRFEETPPRTVGRIVSLATLALLLIVALFRARRIGIVR